ncbi:putative small basic membrane integral protein [Oryza sativa Japonica Group]|uniref:Os01g0182200 protein n=1 Tax=Oryza sativa subsp. japonica TaxID=39947 RepID=A0A0P0UZ45_ORYSJ|nr:putative small basic membrane integral protein [Oryza sativa Japonica Group]BAS70738.1 Os01g0182200 [Oryza sativa Japonica Group]
MAVAAVRAAAADAAVTFLWVLCVSTLGASTAAVTSYLRIHEGIHYALLVTVSLLSVLLFAFNLLCDALAAFHAAGLSSPRHSSLFPLALRFPAQAAGAVGGAMAISELMPEQYKHMLGGPSLKVDLHTGAAAELVLTFVITLAVLWIIVKGPRNPIVKTWMLSISTVCLVLTGAAYTGPSMNPANAFGWAYVNNRHNTWEQFYVYWICPFVGAVLAAWVFRAVFPPPAPKPKAKKA